MTVEKALKTTFNNRSHTGWTTGSHTGEEVPVYWITPQRFLTYCKKKIRVNRSKKKREFPSFSSINIVDVRPFRHTRT